MVGIGSMSIQTRSILSSSIGDGRDWLDVNPDPLYFKI